MSEPRSRWLRGLAWAAGLAVLAAALWLAAPLLSPSTQYPRTGPDLAPLYLGAWSVWWQLDVGDPAVQLQLWDRVGSGPRPAAFHMPYPTTAAVLASPIAYVPWRALFEPFWRLSAGALVLSGLLAGGAVGRGRGAAGVAAAGLGLLAVVGLDVCTHSLELAQVNPLIVLLTTLGAVLLARGRDTAAGAVLALGGAVKLLPLALLLPALALRRWRALGAAALTLLLISALTWAAYPAWSPLGDIGRAWHQLAEVQGPRSTPVAGWWSARAALFGGPAVVLLALVARRPRAPGAAHAAVCLVLAWLAGIAAGLAPPHEMLLMAPAIVLLVAGLGAHGWGWAVLPAAALALAPLTPLDGFADAGRWSRSHAVGLAVLVQALAWATAGAHLWRQRGRPPDATLSAPGGSPG